MPLKSLHEGTGVIEGQLLEIRRDTGLLSETVLEQERLYQDQSNILESLAAKSQEHRQLSDTIYEERILAMLGPPVDSTGLNGWKSWSLNWTSLATAAILPRLNF